MGYHIDVLSPLLALFIKHLTIRIVSLERATTVPDTIPLAERNSPAAGDSTDASTASAIVTDPLASYFYAITRKKTKRQYTFMLGKYFEYLALQGADLQDQAARFLAQAGKDHNWAQRCLINFITDLKRRVEDKEIKGGTLKNHYHAIKLFYEQNDIDLNWKKISRGLPEINNVANDRAPSLEELRKLIEAPDPRVKVIILVMISSGIRLGAWGMLKVKHLTPVPDPKNPNVVIAAKLKVYDGDTNPYSSFVTGEAYQAIQEYLDFRRSYGETITEESWLLRDKFPTTPNDKHAARKSLATNPVKLEVQGVSKVLRTALYVQGLRDLLPEGEHRHEFKLSHGFRKYFKSNAERVMRPLNVELLMDHKTGISDSYWRPTENDLQEDYIRAIEYLTVGKDQKTATLLQKQVAELAEKNEEANQVINTKLAEKDKQIKLLTEEYDRMNEVLTKTASTMSSMLDVFKDLHNRGGKSVSVQKHFKFTSDAISSMKAVSLADGLSEKDFYLLFDDAMLGNRAEMKKRLKKVRGNPKSLKKTDKSLIIAMESIAERLRNEKFVTEIYERHKNVNGKKK